MKKVIGILIAFVLSVSCVYGQTQTTSSRYGVTYMQSYSGRPYLTFNDLVNFVDVMSAGGLPRVVSMYATSPVYVLEATGCWVASEGAAFIVPATPAASSTWDDHEQEIAYYTENGWLFYSPYDGMRALVTYDPYATYWDRGETMDLVIEYDSNLDMWKIIDYIRAKVGIFGRDGIVDDVLGATESGIVGDYSASLNVYKEHDQTQHTEADYWQTIAQFVLSVSPDSTYMNVCNIALAPIPGATFEYTPLSYIWSEENFGFQGGALYVKEWEGYADPDIASGSQVAATSTLGLFWISDGTGTGSKGDVMYRNHADGQTYFANMTIRNPTQAVYSGDPNAASITVEVTDTDIDDFVLGTLNTDTSNDTYIQSIVPATHEVTIYFNQDPAESVTVSIMVWQD